MTKLTLLVAVGLCIGCADFNGLVLQEENPPFDSGSDSDDRPDVVVIDSGADDARHDAGEVETTVVDATADTFVGADADAGEADVVDSGPCTPISHSNGLGQTYMDCAPLGTPTVASTYTMTMVGEARAAWPFAGTNLSGTCSGTGASSYMLKTSTSCAVWVYSKSLAGRVHLNSVDNTCLCATESDPTWN